MGKGAYIRIQNKSSHSVSLVLEDRELIDNRGLDKIQGSLAPGKQLPSEGTVIFQGKYEYIEGDKERIWQKIGGFNLVASVSSVADKASIRLVVDKDEWWTKDHKHGNAGVVLCADVDEVDDKFQIDVRIFDAVKESDWMGLLADHIRNTPLCKVALPGTHDSGTYTFCKDLGAAPDSDLTTTIQEKLEGGKGIFKTIGEKINDQILDQIYKRMCQCQTQSIKQQLEAGVRYLDLRIAYHKECNSFYTCHGVYCANMQTILNDVNSFLTAHPKEIVIMDFNHLYAMEDKHGTFTDTVLKTLGEKVADSNVLKPDSTVGQYWEKGAQAIVIYHDNPTSSGSEGRLWNKGLISSPWPNENDTTGLRQKLKDYMEHRPMNKFFVLQGILTPDGDLIKEEVLSNKGDLSIKLIAKKVSSKVVNWVDDEWFEQSHNICIVDFYENCSMVHTIISLNTRKPM